MEPYEITFLLPKQTQMKGHPVFIAQHATATCCRGCLGKWHRIEKGRALTENEIGFVVELVMGWMREKDLVP
jgi:exodeoxyribonuclease V alpha subunit